MSDQIVIIGAGEAGARAAISLRELGYPGKITMIGDEPFLPYERPPLSKSALIADLAPEPPKLILNAKSLVFQRIELLSNRLAKMINRSEKSVLLDDGRVLSYAKLLLATGASPRKMTANGSSEVFYLRNFADALKLREQLQPATELIVVGAGFIGLEIAASAVARGCKVTVLESAPAILMRGVPANVAHQVSERHKAESVEILTSVSVEAISKQGPRSEVLLKDGRKLQCDLLVAGIGAVPTTSLAEDSGIAIENGIRVDEFLNTNDPDIYAAGDCCSFPHALYDGRRIRLEAWRNAQDQAVVAAANILGAKQPYQTVPWFWSDHYDCTLQVAGLYDAQCGTIERQLDNASIYFHVNKAGRLIAASAIGPNAAIGREIRVCEMLIAQRYMANSVLLENPAIRLKDLLQRVA